MSGETFFVVVGIARGMFAGSSPDLNEVRIFYSMVAAVDYAAKLAEEMGFNPEDQNENTGNWHTELEDIWTTRVDIEDEEEE